MTQTKEYDVIIVGAGPAGMFAADELANKMKVIIIDQGRDINERECKMKRRGICTHCDPCDIMCGSGGAGTFSDGTLNLRPDVGGDLAEQTGDVDYSWKLVEHVDKIFLKYGAPEQLYVPKGDEVEQLKRRAASVGARFIEIIQRHIGSDNAPRIIDNFENDLKDRGIEFLFGTKVSDLMIENGTCTGVILQDGTEINSKFTIIAPGRVGATWIDEVVKKHGIGAKYAPIDVGVRVEVPSIIMDPITKINRDPKFHIQTKTYDDFVRTFCTNEHGFVVKEEYEGFIGTNGHSMRNMESENTNFAFIVRVELTEPMENTVRYGRSIAKLATTIGGGKPLVQRMGDLRRGRRTTEKRLKKNQVQNTLQDITPGDISMALPHRIVTDIREGLDVLNEIIPGVASDSTLLYAPEIKFYSMQVLVDRDMESNVKNLFAAGDGAGLSRDIVNAAATGVIAGRGILKKACI
ncbi:MAG: NAD(P)/FAD-dependent oxidoreductase [Candidatus Methanoperedens sp.]|nr:NAD(P)/FAD-dependent oxidoreductase [Candidatus Methanoperedens sp.]MCE8428356.1 NAD(P)/FAD-dependent oxidoreductase [Candidatus Methanoperedens sp.]